MLASVGTIIHMEVTMNKTLLCSSLLLLASLTMGQSVSAASIKTNYTVNAPSKYQYKKTEWLSYRAAKTDSNGNTYVNLRVKVNGQPETYRGYFAKNDQGQLLIVMRDPKTKRPLAVEGVVKLANVADLEKRGLKLASSRMYGSAKPKDTVIEISWLKKPQLLQSNA